MVTSWLLIVLAIAMIVCGVISGFFLTFSDFLMRSLKLAKTAAGIEVMQIINREVWKSLTIFLLWGMVALSVVLAGYAVAQLNGALAGWMIAGGVLYFVGVLVVSYGFNIPMNHRLAGMAFAGHDAATYWHESYVDRWVFWNYVRAITSGAAAVCFFIACLLLSQNPTFIS